MSGLFVTGTDTDVGKTFVAAGIAATCRRRGLRVGVYKPAATGVESYTSESCDGFILWEAAGRPRRLEDVCPQTFRAPLAPHLAARKEQREIDESLLIRGIDAWSGYDFVIVEGIGGLMSPVSDDLYVADLAAEFGLPLIVVAKNQIGVINQTLQTLITASMPRRNDGLHVAGVVLNAGSPGAADESAADNAHELRTRCHVPLLAQVGWMDDRSFERVPWEDVGRRK